MIHLVSEMADQFNSNLLWTGVEVQMIPRPEMIPKLDCKWSRTANDPQCGPQMISLENEEWLGICSSGRGFNF